LIYSVAPDLSEKTGPVFLTNNFTVSPLLCHGKTKRQQNLIVATDLSRCALADSNALIQRPEKDFASKMTDPRQAQFPIDGSRDALWMDTATAAPATTSVDGQLSCDVAIIGGGFTGLNAAIHLASQGTSVCVLEARSLGYGASGRSGGQVNLGLNLLPSELIAQYGNTAGNRLIQLMLQAPDYVFDLIEEHQMRCDPVRNGWIQAAINQDQEAKHKKLFLDYAQHGYHQFERLDQSQLRKQTGTSRYQSGLLCPAAGSIQPLSYTRELARVAIAKGASIFTDSAVTGLQREPDGWRLSTDRGQVKCEQALICTNGYTGPLNKPLYKKLVPVCSLLIASEPLPPHLRETILPNQVTLVDKRRLILYMRYDRDGRLCIGDHGPLRDSFNSDDFEPVKRRALDVFPQLRSVKWDYHWGGRVAVTRSKIPFLYRIAPGLTAAMGYNGRGVGMGSIMGKTVADTILRRDDRQSKFPARLSCPWAVSVVLKYRWMLRATSYPMNTTGTL